uniref:Uncharacterized protein n=1 Tax=Arundo donax TaxID=35708 RepID=A0A0A8ZX02_ARUDO
MYVRMHMSVQMVVQKP